MKPRVFISSPLRAATARAVQDNILKASRYCRRAYERGYAPYAPHVYLTRFLMAGVEAEDEWAMEFGREWLDECDEIWVFDGEGITPGMHEEVAYAESKGKVVKYESKGEI